MPMFTKFTTIRSSVHLPSVFKQRSSPSSPDTPVCSSPYSSNSLSVTNLSQKQQEKEQQQQQQREEEQQQRDQKLRGRVSSYHGLQRHRTASAPTNTATSFTETLRVISQQVQQNQFDDVFGSFFFTEKRCRHRAVFMAARLQQNMGTFWAQYYHQHYQQRDSCIPNSFWFSMIDRFYTLNYLLFVIPPSDSTRFNYLSALEQHMGSAENKVGQRLKDRRGGMETYFALYYVMEQHSGSEKDESHLMMTIEQARKILEHCLDSESKLGHAERDAMYIFHGLRAGFHGQVEPKVMMDDDDELRDTIQEAVYTNKKLTTQPYVNPFEDDACIVNSDDDHDNIENLNSQAGVDTCKTRQVDSGFYDGVI